MQKFTRRIQQIFPQQQLLLLLLLLFYSSVWKAGI
jgi:hypothetical protein